MDQKVTVALPTGELVVELSDDPPGITCYYDGKVNREAELAIIWVLQQVFFKHSGATAHLPS